VGGSGGEADRATRVPSVGKREYQKPGPNPKLLTTRTTEKRNSGPSPLRPAHALSTAPRGNPERSPGGNMVKRNLQHTKTEKGQHNTLKPTTMPNGPNLKKKIKKILGTTDRKIKTQKLGVLGENWTLYVSRRFLLGNPNPHPTPPTGI